MMSDTCSSTYWYLTISSWTSFLPPKTKQWDICLQVRRERPGRLIVTTCVFIKLFQVMLNCKPQRLFALPSKIIHNNNVTAGGSHEGHPS